MAEENRVTEWNQAQATQMRIDVILRKCHEASWEKDYKGWLSGIWSLFRELSPFFKEEERDEALKKIRNAQNSSSGNNRNPPFEDYVKAESYLRRLLDEKGFLVPKVEDARKAIYD